MNRSEKLRKRRYDRQHKLFLIALTGFSIGGCAMPQRPRRPGPEMEIGPGAEIGSVDRVAANGSFAEDQQSAIDGNLIESSPRPSGVQAIAVGHRVGSVIATTAATKVPAIEIIPDPSTPENQSPSDLELPTPVSIPILEASDADMTASQQPVDYFVRLALAGHPSIQAARHRVAAEINRIPQDSALPDPMFNNTFWPFQDQALQTAAGRVGNQMSLTQSVPFPKKLKTKAAIISQEVQIAQAEVEQIEREISESVRLAYYEVWFASQAITITQEIQELVRDLAQVAEARYRSGGTQQDVLRARLESDRLEEQLVGLVKQKQMAQADLATLVQQPLNLLPEATPELSLNDSPSQLDELIARAEQCNPKINGLAWEIQRDRQKQKLACLQRYPDMQVGLHWGLVSDDDKVLSAVANGHDMISFNVGTTLPIWRNKINSGIREAANRSSNSAQRLQAERDALFGKLRRLVTQADALQEQRKIYVQRIIPRAEDTLKLSIADYRGKRTDFFSLIETYRELLMFETQLARIDATLAGTLAQIDRAVGCPDE